MFNTLFLFYGQSNTFLLQNVAVFFNLIDLFDASAMDLCEPKTTYLERFDTCKMTLIYWDNKKIITDRKLVFSCLHLYKIGMICFRGHFRLNTTYNNKQNFKTKQKQCTTKNQRNFFFVTFNSIYMVQKKTQETFCINLYNVTKLLLYEHRVNDWIFSNQKRI